ncbi:hypothetical protein FPQ18DRAFT_155830 [Pyronema domesticum]|nr:hypothetical protein FPQ18DRAFT_155830 [Pyronema domesticum]
MESMNLIRFEQIKRFLNLSDPLLSMSAAQNELVEQLPTLCNKIKCRIFDASWIIPPKDLAADKILMLFKKHAAQDSTDWKKRTQDWFIDLAWDLVNEGARRMKEKKWMESQREQAIQHASHMQQLQTAQAINAGQPMYFTSNFPQTYAPPEKKKPRRIGTRGPYVSKTYRLPETRFLNRHPHHMDRSLEPGTNLPIRSNCMFCKFLFHQTKGPQRREQLKTVLGSDINMPRSLRRTVRHCSFCKVALCKDLCFPIFHRVTVDSENNVTGLM